MSLFIQGGTYTTVGERITKRSMTCHLPRNASRVHNPQLDFEAIRPADSNFSSLPLGGARQIYTVSVSNNGRNFSSSQTYTLYNSTCMKCNSSGIVQRVSCAANGLFFFDCYASAHRQVCRRYNVCCCHFYLVFFQRVISEVPRSIATKLRMSHVRKCL